jgi:hypothetical protein
MRRTTTKEKIMEQIETKERSELVKIGIYVATIAVVYVGTKQITKFRTNRKIKKAQKAEK